ncbi:MAG: glycerophosphodiester phosphodiesterase [Gammaproteobacteria bacterium]|nr:glycerophosphodiester phosphodiesterase [Gammaproteobacteria bacterium]
MTFRLSKVIGHRGASGHAPENTRISMSKAHQLGAEWVEFDVMLARSGEPIIIHDETLGRTTNGTGEVADIDFETLACLDCGSWFGAEFSDQRIPTLQNLLDHIIPLNLAINIEIKPYPGYEEQTAIRTLEVLQSHWPKSSPEPLISSFSPLVLKKLFELSREYKLGYIIDSLEGNWEQVLRNYGCISLHIDHHLLTLEIVKRIKKVVPFVLAYTVNEPERAQQLFDWGVDSVFSDYPDRILKVIA